MTVSCLHLTVFCIVTVTMPVLYNCPASNFGRCTWWRVVLLSRATPLGCPLLRVVVGVSATVAKIRHEPNETRLHSALGAQNGSWLSTLPTGVTIDWRFYLDFYILDYPPLGGRSWTTLFVGRPPFSTTMMPNLREYPLWCGRPPTMAQLPPTCTMVQ
jgi:hypothetical protein